MKSFAIAVLLILVKIHFSSAHYTKTFVEDLCGANGITVLNLGSGNANSSGILRASRDGKFLKGLNCTILIQPPLGYGVVLSVRHLDFRPFYPSKCLSFVKIFGSFKTTQLCGYSDDISEYQSYSSEGNGLELQFNMVNKSGQQYHSDFEFIVTSYVKLDYSCEVKMFECGNSRCIWKGLTCDGHNNCGDQSDEYPHRRASCGLMSPGIIAAIVVGSVMGFLLIIIISFACCRCNSRYRQSQNSAQEPALIQSPPSYGSNEGNNAYVPAPRYGSGHVRGNIPALSFGPGPGRSNIQEEDVSQEHNSFQRRYQDLPPAYKE